MDRLVEIQRLLEPLQLVVKDPPTPQRLAVMVKILSEFPIESVAAAADLALRRFTFWPSPAQMIELIRDRKAEAEEAWHLILRHVARNGSMSALPPGFPAEAKMALENIGGLSAVGGCEVEKIPYLGKQFRECYGIMVSRSEFKNALPEGPVRGLLDKIGGKGE